jgi:hypothetical protein
MFNHPDEIKYLDSTGTLRKLSTLITAKEKGWKEVRLTHLCEIATHLFQTVITGSYGWESSGW